LLHLELHRLVFTFILRHLPLGHFCELCLAFELALQVADLRLELQHLHRKLRIVDLLEDSDLAPQIVPFLLQLESVLQLGFDVL